MQSPYSPCPMYVSTLAHPPPLYITQPAQISLISLLFFAQSLSNSSTSIPMADRPHQLQVHPQRGQFEGGVKNQRDCSPCRPPCRWRATCTCWFDVHWQSHWACCNHPTFSHLQPGSCPGCYRCRPCDHRLSELRSFRFDGAVVALLGPQLPPSGQPVPAARDGPGKKAHAGHGSFCGAEDQGGWPRDPEQGPRGKENMKGRRGFNF
jgi:hypothetical protein